MLCLFELCLSREHFNRLYSIKDKIATAYILPREV